MNIEIILEKNFPARLREIPTSPKQLYLRGTIPNWDQKFLAVVGARKYTNYGKEVCEKLIAGLRGNPITIVSGLALGIDSIAHRSALSANFKTIAVPGSGLGNNVLYPRNHTALAEKIVASGGALLSEFEPDFRATVWSFPQRNRIMAGLSHAVLVIEAEEKSGTLITSRLATEYNRDVLTVPGSIFSSQSAGPHMLIRLGATPVRSSKDILEVLGLKTEERGIDPLIKYADCSPEEMKIVELLTEPREREELIQALQMETSELNAILTLLEIKGLIKETMGEIHLA